MRRRLWAVIGAAVVLLAGCGDDDGGSDGGDGAATTTSAPATTTTVVEPQAAFGAEPVVVGHRGGADGDEPDNSLEALANARERGATWVEIDVRLAADGTVVLSHDPETAAGTVVARATADELAAEGLPTLEEALEVIDEQALGLDLEIKADPTEEHLEPLERVADESLAVLDAHPIQGPIVVSSFNRGIIDRVGQLSDDGYDTALIAAGVGGVDDLVTSLVAGGHEGVILAYEAATPEVVGPMVDAGLVVWAWTVDDASLLADLAAVGVTGIVTDVPEQVQVIGG